MRDPLPRPPCPDCGSRLTEHVGWDDERDAARFHCRRCGKLWSAEHNADDGERDA